MKKYLILLTILNLTCFIPERLNAREPQVKVKQILRTSQSWDGVDYTSYPLGQPQVSALRITIPPHTSLNWHHHPMISVAYVLSGHLTVEKKATGERTTVQAGQTLAETVQTTHRGFTTNESVELIVFYAGRLGLPLSIKDE